MAFFCVNKAKQGKNCRKKSNIVIFLVIILGPQSRCGGLLEILVDCAQNETALLKGLMTDDNGNAVFQSLVKKMSLQETAEDLLVPSLWKKRESIVCFLHTSDRLLFDHTPDQRPLHITGHCVKTVTLGWSEPPTSAPPQSS